MKFTLLLFLTGSTMLLVSGMGWKSPRLCLNTAVCSVSSFVELLLSSKSLYWCFYSTIGATCTEPWPWNRRQPDNRSEWEVDVRPTSTCRFPVLIGANTCRVLAPLTTTIWSRLWCAALREKNVSLPLIIGCKASSVETGGDRRPSDDVTRVLFECQQCIVIPGGVAW